MYVPPSNYQSFGSEGSSFLVAVVGLEYGSMGSSMPCRWHFQHSVLDICLLGGVVAVCSSL